MYVDELSYYLLHHSFHLSSLLLFKKTFPCQAQTPSYICASRINIRTSCAHSQFPISIESAAFTRLSFGGPKKANNNIARCSRKRTCHQGQRALGAKVEAAAGARRTPRIDGVVGLARLSPRAWNVIPPDSVVSSSRSHLELRAALFKIQTFNSPNVHLCPLVPRILTRTPPPWIIFANTVSFYTTRDLIYLMRCIDVLYFLNQLLFKTFFIFGGLRCFWILTAPGNFFPWRQASFSFVSAMISHRAASVRPT